MCQLISLSEYKWLSQSLFQHLKNFWTEVSSVSDDRKTFIVVDDDRIFTSGLVINTPFLGLRFVSNTPVCREILISSVSMRYEK